MYPLVRSLCVAAVALSLPAATLAQQKPDRPPGENKGATKGDSKGDRNQIEITAENGIEWDKAAGAYIARGNARVTRAGRTVTADQITAYHRGQGTSKSDIYRVDAEGSVKLANDDSVMTADRAIYDNDNKVARMTGKSLTITTPDYKITARDSIEYWDEKRFAVARGNVVVIRSSDQMRADQAVAYFEPKDGSRPDPAKPGSSDGQRIARVEGFGNVYIASCQCYAHAEKGLYDPNTGTAVLSGNVRLTRGREQLNGETVEMNTRTGYTRVIAGSGSRIYATLEPNKDASTPDPRPTDRPGAAPCDEKQDKPSPDPGPQRSR
jgi:lipopolysaccharide export system protein LptA